MSIVNVRVGIKDLPVHQVRTAVAHTVEAARVQMAVTALLVLRVPIAQVHSVFIIGRVITVPAVIMAILAIRVSTVRVVTVTRFPTCMHARTAVTALAVAMVRNAQVDTALIIIVPAVIMARLVIRVMTVRVVTATHFPVHARTAQMALAVAMVRNAQVHTVYRTSVPVALLVILAIRVPTV